MLLIPIFLNGFDQQFFGIKEDHVPVMVINDDKEKYVKPNVEPHHLESWLKEYKVIDSFQ